MSTAEEMAERLEISQGAASESMCRVYARLPRGDLDSELKLSGTLRGPHCQYAATLEATYHFTDRGGPSFLFAEALVPEPCYWTPAMPQLYDAVLQVTVGERVIARMERVVGLRCVSAVPHQLIVAGKNTVLRGAAADELPQDADLSDWHDADTAMFVRNPSDALCDAASRIGVFLIAELGTSETDEIERLRRWPSVGLICLSGKHSSDLSGGGVILAQRVAANESLVPAAGMQVAVVEAEANAALSEQVAQLHEWRVPVVAIRRAGALASIAEGRRLCDTLQRDLAPLGQFAGYIV